MKKSIIRRTTGIVAAAAALAMAASCNLVNTSPASLKSVYSGTVPVQYDLAASTGIAALSVNRSDEGVVMASTLDEYELPAAWAKATLSGSYYLYDAVVDPAGADSASFVTDGTDYYAKWITIGADTDAKVFTASVSGGSVTYTFSDSAETIAIPDTNMSSANIQWYYQQMAAGNYYLASDSTGTEIAGINYANDSSGSLAFTGATKANRWLKSANDSTWKSGRDAMLAFCDGKVLIGAGSLALTTAAGTWKIGVDATEIPSTWDLDTYFDLYLDTYTSAGDTTVDTTTGASE